MIIAPANNTPTPSCLPINPLEVCPSLISRTSEADSQELRSELRELIVAPGAPTSHVVAGGSVLIGSYYPMRQPLRVRVNRLMAVGAAEVGAGGLVWGQSRRWLGDGGS